MIHINIRHAISGDNYNTTTNNKTYNEVVDWYDKAVKAAQSDELSSLIIPVGKNSEVIIPGTVLKDCFIKILDDGKDE